MTPVPYIRYKNKLTILLPLFSRSAFTVRYLQYLQEIQFPFRVLIADGSDDRELQSRLEQKLIAPFVDYTYVRFPQDKTLLDYYKKLASAAELIETPYVMLQDNDDLPVVSAIHDCIDFLENNSEYVGATGRVGGFTLQKERDNLFLHFHEDYFDDAYLESFEQRTALERIRHQLTKNRAFNLYYGIYRTEKAKAILDDLQELNFSDLRLQEAYYIEGLMAFGKVKVFNSEFSYLRQRGTSVGTTLLKPWCQDLFFGAWIDQFDRYSIKLAQRVVLNSEDATVIEVEKRIREYYLEYILRKPFFEAHFWQRVRKGSLLSFLARNIKKIFKKLWVIKKRSLARLAQNRFEHLVKKYSKQSDELKKMRDFEFSYERQNNVF